MSARMTKTASRMLSQKKTIDKMPSTSAAVALPLPVRGCG